MSTPRKFWFILIAAILAMALIACSCGSIIPTLTTSTSAAPPTAPVPPTALAPTSDHAMPELEGYWQILNVATAIAWQNGQYVVMSVIDSEEGSLKITSQSWNGSALTWTYYRPSNDTSFTYTTSSVSGDKLFIDYSTSTGTSGSVILHRVSSAQPSYGSLPISDNFSDPNSGWDTWKNTDGSVGYSNGSYFAIANTNGILSTGFLSQFFGDTVIEVDATVVSGPSDNNFGYEVECRDQRNGSSYSFQVLASGYYMVGVMTNTGKGTYTFKSLLSTDKFQTSIAIHRGLATNHLAVTCSGSQLKLEVNGQVLFDGQDSTHPNGNIGLGAVTFDDKNTPAEVHFHNLVVRAP